MSCIDEITLIYKNYNYLNKNIKIFGKEFVEFNKYTCYIDYNKKKI